MRGQEKGDLLIQVTA